MSDVIPKKDTPILCNIWIECLYHALMVQICLIYVCSRIRYEMLKGLSHEVSAGYFLACMEEYGPENDPLLVYRYFLRALLLFNNHFFVFVAINTKT